MANELGKNRNSRVRDSQGAAGGKLESLLRKCYLHGGQREAARATFEEERAEALLAAYEAYCYATKFPAEWARLNQSFQLAKWLDTDDPAIVILYRCTCCDSDETRDWATWMRYAFLAKVPLEQSLALLPDNPDEFEVYLGDIRERFKREFPAEYLEWKEINSGE